MEIDLYSFQHYRDYLLAKVGPKSERRGIKSQLARALRCQPSMLSQVLGGSIELSLEQGASANHFFGHTANEASFFILLLLHARAGTTELRKHFEVQLQELREQSMILSKRIKKSGELSIEQRSIYYSSWHYAAIHIATSIPALQSREAICNFFGLPKRKVTSVITFLEQSSLVVLKNGRLRPGKKEIFLGSDSDLILRHHTNWRMRAIESFDREAATDLHYSAVVSLSKGDVFKIKALIMGLIQETLKVIQTSPEEELYSLGMDFYNLNQAI